MYILGISAFYHDSAATLIKDGCIVAAAQEERFTRKKHDSSFPSNAISYCMQYEQITHEQLDAIIYYDDPVLTLDRFLVNISFAGKEAREIIERTAEKFFSEKMWIGEYVKKCIGGLGKMEKVLIAKHHYSHAASAFYPSPYNKATIITLDGVGEWNTTTIGYGEGNKIKLLKKIDFPNSLGLLYSAFTYFCGFKVNYGDYKLMGLAPYGQPVYYELIKNELIQIKEDGSFSLNLKYFDFQFGRAMTNAEFSKLFGGAPRKPETKISKREMDMAASVQKIVEEVVVKLARYAAGITNNNENLVLAGGVALNCVANGVLKETGVFKNIWVQPAAGDAGGSLGAAMLAYYDYFDNVRVTSEHSIQKGSFWGPSYSDDYIRSILEESKAQFHYITDNRSKIIAEHIDKQKVIGLFQGRMEFGPRSLGNRSIIADARSEKMQTKLNLSIKYRESFRPFAPAVLEERVSDYFEDAYYSPYMLFCMKVKKRMDEDFSLYSQIESDDNMISIIERKRSDIPAVTHVDYSARVQTVNEYDNADFYAVIKEFEKLTGCGVVINTSFNVRGEPIVCTPEDAFRCFMNTEMDVLVLENFILFKEEQNTSERRNDVYELD